MKGKVMISYTALRHRIRAGGHSQKSLAEEIGMSEWQLCRKLKGESGFTQEEILRISASLDIPTGEIGPYFFTEK